MLRISTWKGQRNNHGINHGLGLNRGSPWPSSFCHYGPKSGRRDHSLHSPEPRCLLKVTDVGAGEWERDLCLVRDRNCPEHQPTSSILHPRVPRHLQWLKLAKTQSSQNIYISARQRFMGLWISKYTGFHGKLKKGSWSFCDKWTRLAKMSLQQSSLYPHGFSSWSPTCITSLTTFDWSLIERK